MTKTRILEVTYTKTKICTTMKIMRTTITKSIVRTITSTKTYTSTKLETPIIESSVLGIVLLGLGIIVSYIASTRK